MHVAPVRLRLGVALAEPVLQEAEKDRETLRVETVRDSVREPDTEGPLWLRLSRELREVDREPDPEGLWVSVGTRVAVAVRVSVRLAPGDRVGDGVGVAEGDGLGDTEGLLLMVWVRVRQAVEVPLPDGLGEWV